MPETSAIFLPKGISDHCPTKVTVREIRPKIRRQFQYCNVWGLHPTFLDVVEIG